MVFTHLQIEWDPRLGGYHPLIPVLSALCSQLNLLNPPLENKVLGYTTDCHDYTAARGLTAYSQNTKVKVMFLIHNQKELNFLP
jgi:hypothetical protein